MNRFARINNFNGVKLSIQYPILFKLKLSTQLETLIKK